jgi:hypothetical protein
MTDHDVIEELREQLRVALDRIDELERELEARRRTERDERLGAAVNRPKRRPPVQKPLRPRTDSEWRRVLRDVGREARGVFRAL